MHELSLVMSVLNIVEEYAAKHGFEKVNSLKLSFGRLSCIEPSALEFAFSIQSRETRADGASLEFDIRPIIVSCLACNDDSLLPSYPGLCPSCGSGDVVLKGGIEDLTLVEIDVD